MSQSLDDIIKLVTIQLTASGKVDIVNATLSIKNVIDSVIEYMKEQAAMGNLNGKDKMKCLIEQLYLTAQKDLQTRNLWSTQQLDTSIVIAQKEAGVKMNNENVLSIFRRPQVSEQVFLTYYIHSKDRDYGSATNQSFSISVNDVGTNIGITAIELMSFDTENADVFSLASYKSDFFIYLNSLDPTNLKRTDKYTNSHFVCRALIKKDSGHPKFKIIANKIVFNTVQRMPSTIEVELTDEYQRPLVMRNDMLIISAITTNPVNQTVIFTVPTHQVNTGDILLIRNVICTADPSLLKDSQGLRASVLDDTHIAVYKWAAGLVPGSFIMTSAYMLVPQNSVKLTIRFYAE